MKLHTTGFKNKLKKLGRQLKAIITYDNITLEEELFSVTPHYEANLLKSVMKQLDIESSVAIPLETIVNCKIGLKINGSYEMLDYGNYVIYSVEKQEDTNTYKIIAYDKMLYAMKEYEALEVQYPITIANYLIALGNKIGLQVANTTFYNSSLTIPMDLYDGLQYTYRDILDEIAEAIGSIIVINSDDEIEVKYPTNTNDTIDEEYLKDINVNFGEKYGPVNSIVLSRAAEADNVYIRDEQSVEQNGLCEIKIIDNQIMNFNDRSDYLQGLLNALNGLYYYINDFNSIGIMYYDVGDIYNVTVGENTYQCIMLNDEIVVKSGIQEIIHTEMPEQSQTDYTKADKTDRKINQTYLIVDKQNQAIESVISNVSEQNNKISQITQTVDEINSKLEDIADITTSAESVYATVSLADINESEPIELKIHPITTNISYLYPRSNLYPSDTLYLTNRIIRFIRTYEEDGETLTENIDYELPDNLLYYDSENYDEFYLNYDSQTCQVIKRCELNANGVVESWTAIGYPPVITDYPYPQILLGDGDYEVKILGYETGYISARLMAKNIYTSQFYTKAETNAKIEEKADEIDIGVNQKLSNYSTTNEMNAAINIKANEINLKVEEKLDEDDFTGANIMLAINNDSSSASIDADKISLNGKTINLTSDDIAINSTHLNIDKNGNTQITSSASSYTGAELKLIGQLLTNYLYSSAVVIRPNSVSSNLGIAGMEVVSGNNGYEGTLALTSQNGEYISLIPTQGIDVSSNIHAIGTVTGSNIQSDERLKKNIKDTSSNALDIINKINHKEFDWIKDNKHTNIGYIAQELEKIDENFIIKENDTYYVNLLPILATTTKAIQEQQQEIEELRERINVLEGGK